MTTGVQPRPGDAEGTIALTLRVNGREHQVRARPTHTLLEVLRNEFGLTGPREGCDIGMCGACTVLVDGRPLSGCLLLAALAEGREIVTVVRQAFPRGLLAERHCLDRRMQRVTYVCRRRRKGLGWPSWCCLSERGARDTGGNRCVDPVV